MQSNELALHIGASPHTFGRTEQDPHSSTVDLIEQRRLRRVGVGFMNEGDFMRGNAEADQTIFDSPIDMELVGMGRGQVTKGKLGRFGIRSFFPYLVDLVDDEIDLGLRMVGCHGIEQP